MTFGITIYLRSGKAVVKVEINDPSVEVTVKGRTAVLKAPGQEIEVEPGENELTITLANLRFTTKSFTLKKGQNKAVTVELVDSKLAAKFGDEILEERPVAPLPRERAGTDAETTLATTAHPAPLIAPFDQSDARAARAAWARSYHVGEETTNALGMKLAPHSGRDISHGRAALGYGTLEQGRRATPTQGADHAALLPGHLRSDATGI